MDKERELIKGLTVHLIAAVSLLEYYHSITPKGKRDPLYKAKLADYKAAIEMGREFWRKHAEDRS